MDTMLAYSPVLPLIESHVAIYKIYILKNPYTQEIFYVGQTMQDIETRLSGHLQESESNKEKVEYIKRICEQGEKPIIESIETIATTCYIDKMAVHEREIYWIRYYKSLGCSLLNISSTAPDTKCKEYHTYLSAIKKGTSSYHYYYCGKTAAGIRVYDEKRLRADGFRLPEPAPIPKEEPEYKEYPYNPYEYSKFKLKNKIRDEEKGRENKYVITEIFPVQPSWSAEFASQIPYNDLMEDMGIDDCDYECDELENDLSDYEPDFDGEDEDADEEDNREYQKLK